MKFCESSWQCNNCINNIKNEKERNKAIRIYLIKSPISFKKISMDLIMLLVIAKKSNCFKNYWECFQFGLKSTYSDALIVKIEIFDTIFSICKQNNNINNINFNSKNEEEANINNANYKDGKKKI